MIGIKFNQIRNNNNVFSSEVIHLDKNSENYRSDEAIMLKTYNYTQSFNLALFQFSLFQSCTLPILHSTNIAIVQSYTLPILLSSNLALFQVYNLTLFQSYTLPIKHSSNPPLFQSHTLPMKKCDKPRTNNVDTRDPVGSKKS